MKGYYHIKQCYLPCALLVAAGSLIAPASFSQGLYNGTDIRIDGTNLYVDGEIFNEGTLQNSGAVALTGDWKSEGKYNGNGAVELYGDRPQKITHYNQAFETLIVNGSGTKYVKGRLNIDAQLLLKDGIVEVSTDDMLKLDAKAVAIGGSTRSYIDGALTVNGPGYRYFPIGKNGNFAPIEFIDATGLNIEYSVEAFENAPPVSIDNIIVRNGLYWHRKDIKGSFRESRVAIDFQRTYFGNPENVVLLAGSGWDEPFAMVSDIEHSTETDKITTRVAISSPIIMLGEVSTRWTEADFYLPTALSPHASQTANESVKIFGHRLRADQFVFQVFSRHGDLVFESRSLQHMMDNGWDGRTSSGVELMTGTYPYRLSAFDKTGKKFDKKGVITIVR